MEHGVYLQTDNIYSKQIASFAFCLLLSIIIILTKQKDNKMKELLLVVLTTAFMYMLVTLTLDAFGINTKIF